MSRSNTVFIGRKPALNYVLACMTLFKGGSNEVAIKARGRSISRAVDVAEVIRNRFMTNLKVESIKTGTEQIKSEESNTPSNVSTIEITLKQ